MQSNSKKLERFWSNWQGEQGASTNSIRRELESLHTKET